VIGEAYAPGRGFKGLARYLRDGHLGEESPERVAWMETRNLPTQNLEVAACFMAATSRRSARTEKPLFHFSVSFDHSDQVNRALMRRVADRTLHDLGLEGYQVLIVAHRDRAHPHLHFMVNRVHPARGTAWSDSFTFKRIEQTLRAQEVELGLRVVPGWHARVPGREQERPAPRLARGGPEFVARVQRDAGAVLLEARSWAEVERGLAAHGLWVRIKGGGLVVTDGVQEVKASQIDRAVSRRHLEARLGALGAYNARKALADRTLADRTPRAEPVQPELAPAAKPEPVGEPEAPQQPPPAALPPTKAVQLSLPLEPERTQAPRRPAPAAEPRRAPEGPQQPAPAPQPAPAAPPLALRAPEPRREAPPAPEPSRAAPPPAPPAAVPVPTPGSPRAPEPPRTHREAVREYSRAARALFTHATPARHAFLAAVAQYGPERAAAALAREPQRFGTLQPDVTPQMAIRVANAAYAYAGYQEGRQRPRLKWVAEPLRAAHEAMRPDRELRNAEDRFYRAEAEVQGLEDRLRIGLARIRTIKEDAEGTYADPAGALQALHEHRRLHGVEETVRVLRQTPEQFGALLHTRSGRVLGTLLRGSEAYSRGRARVLAAELQNSDWAFGKLPSAEDVALARGRVKEAAAVRDAARTVRDRFQNQFGNVDVAVSRLIRDAAMRMRSLKTGDLAQDKRIQRRLDAMVPTSGLWMLTSAVRIARELDPDQREQDRSRGLSL
jgi:hypothetical protein